MYMVGLNKNPNFCPKTSCYGPKWLFSLVQKILKVVRPMGLIEADEAGAEDATEEVEKVEEGSI